MIDYVREVGHLTFKKLPFNAADSLVITQFAYLNFELTPLCSSENDIKIALSSLGGLEQFEKLFTSAYNPVETERLYQTAMVTERYKNLYATKYVNIVDSDKECQFSAILITEDDGIEYVAFRGTDSSLVGWKENFMLSFSESIPSQSLAVDYLNSLGDILNENIIIGGHSKGGNLAIYAAARCRDDIKAKICVIYDHDGPGFYGSFLQSPDFLAIQHKIHTTLPQTAVISLMLPKTDCYHVVKSNAFSVFQHDPYSWQTDSKGFIYMSDINLGALAFKDSATHLMKTIPAEQRQSVVNILFRLMGEAEGKTIKEIQQHWRKNLYVLTKALIDLSEEERHEVISTLQLIFMTTLKSRMYGGREYVKCNGCGSYLRSDQAVPLVCKNCQAPLERHKVLGSGMGDMIAKRLNIRRRNVTSAGENGANDKA